jgi:putative endonuclease
MRIAEHNAGTFEGYTASRRPVELIFSQWFDQITDAIETRRKLKKWSRAKKEAFIRGDFASLQQLAKRKSPHPSRRPPAGGLLRMRVGVVWRRHRPPCERCRTSPSQHRHPGLRALVFAGDDAITPYWRLDHPPCRLSR